MTAAVKRKSEQLCCLEAQEQLLVQTFLHS